MDNQIDVTDEQIAFDELLMKYLRNELSDTESQEFINSLNADPEKKAHAIVVARLIKQLKIKAKTEDDDFINRLRSAKQSQKNKTIKLFAKILAAAVLVGLGIYIAVFYYQKAQNQSIVAENYSIISFDGTSRGIEDENVKAELNALWVNVKTATNLDNTISKLDSLWHYSLTDEGDVYADYTIQLSQILVLAHLKNNNRKQSKVVLTKMIEIYGKDSQAGIWAETLLKKL